MFVRMAVVLLALLMPAFCFSQTWTTVPAPTKPLAAFFDEEQSQISNHTWLYPFTQPTPAGVYEVSNCIIDKSQKLGAWSQPKTISMQSGWYLYAHSWNQPVTSDDAGIAWRVKVVTSTPQFEYTPYFPGSEHYFYCGWSGQYPANQVAPYSYTLPRLQELKQDSRRLYRLNLFQTGGRNTTVAPAPVCYGSNLLNVPMEIAYSRVSETGETELSPSYVFTPPTPHEGWVVAETCDLGFGIQEQHPQGTIGYHLYVKYSGGVWQRLPAPHCFGEPATPDDWLWQWHDRQPAARRTVVNAPTHQPSANPRSRLNSLQIGLKNGAGNVQVSGNAAINAYCPIIDEWRSSPATFGRRIAAADGGKWKINQQQSQSGHRYWPVLAIENSYSQWVGVEVQANGGSAAISFADFSGGQAFGNRFIDCNFYTQPSTTGIVTAFLIDTKSTGQYGSHTGSEIKCYNTKGNGDVVIWVGGQQSANIRFSESNFTCTGAGRQCSAAYFECPNQVVFTNGLNIDARYAGTVFRASTFNAKLLADGIWVDQECACLIEACGVGIEAKLNGGKMNIRGASPVLARLIDQHSPSRITFSDIDIQPDPGVAGIDVVNGNYNAVELRFTDTYLSEFTTLREPTLAQTTALLRTIMYDPSYNATEIPVPGMRLSIPQQVSPLAATGPTQDASLVFNSLTGRQTVKRANWTD